MAIHLLCAGSPYFIGEIYLKNPFLFKYHGALYREDPYQIQMHIIAEHIFIIEKHVVIVAMIAG